MEKAGSILGRILGLDDTSNPMTPEEWEKFKADDYNKKPGKLHEQDGYDCPVCLNKGDIWVAVQNHLGWWEQRSRECKCMEVRRNISRMKQSGLKDIIKDYTFAKYEVTDDWQRIIKNAAMEYAKNPHGWFSVGGQSGCGKTHICTAICREFLLSGRQVVYMLWRDDIERIKGFAKDDPEQRMEMIERFKTAEVLYIDDLFKTGKDREGKYMLPTTADINAAFEIINYRALNPDLLTIISSEWTEDDLLDIDEATGGRIFEKTGSNGFSIAKDRSKNYRTRKTVKL